MSTNTINRFTSRIEEDKYGDYFITIPQELISQLGWVEGDLLVWTINEDNSVTLHKKDQK